MEIQTEADWDIVVSETRHHEIALINKKLKNVHLDLAESLSPDIPIFLRVLPLNYFYSQKWSHRSYKLLIYWWF